MLGTMKSIFCELTPPTPPPPATGWQAGENMKTEPGPTLFPSHRTPKDIYICFSHNLGGNFAEERTIRWGSWGVGGAVQKDLGQRGAGNPTGRTRDNLLTNVASYIYTYQQLQYYPYIAGLSRNWNIRWRIRMWSMDATRQSIWVFEAVLVLVLCRGHPGDISKVY